MEYTPIEVDPFGLTTIEAKCKSVKVSRSKPSGGSSRRDAVEYSSGKTFRIGVGPTGKIEDYSQLDALIQEIGQKAFRPGTENNRIKEPDMICDFVATQWFLWDPIASVDKPSEGVRIGQTWNSQLSVPGPMVMRKARDVTYKLDEIRDTEDGRVAVISSSYIIAESTPASWPIPYSGRFRMSGRFGFLSGYKILDLKGQGEELFNIDAGRAEQYEQQYVMQMRASIPLGISAKPLIIIDQSITMQRL
jgi:hypothetical protein